MARYEVHRTDANAAAIYRAAKKLGFSVERTERPTDSAWGIYDQTVLVEVKTDIGTLRPKQVKFFGRFKGLKRLVRTESDVVAIYQFMRDRYEHQPKEQINGQRLRGKDPNGRHRKRDTAEA